MTDVAKCEQAIKLLEDKQRHLVERSVELANERAKLSFDAHANNDQKARSRLDKINLEHATQASEMNSLTEALNEAQARLNVARAAEAMAADRAAALKLREAQKRFTELGLVIDDALADIVSASNEMNDVLNTIHSLGCASPNHNQMRVMGTIAIKTAVMSIPWTAREWEFLAPNQRKSFRQIVSGWHEMIANNIAARLGEKNEKAA